MQKKCFKIENNFYSQDILLQVISDFSDIANISLENNELCIEWENFYEIDEIFNEFMNYVIWLYNELN